MSVGSVPKRLSFDWSRPTSSNLFEFRCTIHLAALLCGSVVVLGYLKAREGVEGAVSLQFRVAEEPNPTALIGVLKRRGNIANLSHHQKLVDRYCA